MSEEEMISEIEIYLSHVIAKDFPLPKAIRLMYEEYKNSNKAWEKIYDEDQNYIGELNDKILDLEFEIKKQQKELEKLKSRKYILNAETQEIKEIPISDDYISKDKIKEKMRGEINKSWRNTEQRKCQLYAYDILKELLGE